MLGPKKSAKISVGVWCYMMSEVRHCGDSAGAFRDNMQGGMRLFDHVRAGVRPRVPGAVPWREKYHAAQ